MEKPPVVTVSLECVPQWYMNVWHVLTACYLSCNVVTVQVMER